MVKINGRNIVKSVFPNAELQFEPYVVSPPGIITAPIYPSMELIFNSNDDIFNLLVYKKYLDNVMPYAQVDLTIKFCPYGQADRDFPGSFGTFKYFAKLINDAHFRTVTIFDPHSEVMVATLDRCVALYPITRFATHKYDLLFYPDAGAAKKYSEIIDNTHYLTGHKKRNLVTGEIIKYEILGDQSDIAGKKILIVDDLVVRGGTYKYAARALKDMGAALVDLFITHVMPSAKEFWTREYSECGINKVYTSNTLYLPWASNFASSIEANSMWTGNAADFIYK